MNSGYSPLVNCELFRLSNVASGSEVDPELLNQCRFMLPNQCDFKCVQRNEQDPQVRDSGIIWVFSYIETFFGTQRCGAQCLDTLKSPSSYHPLPCMLLME